MPPLAGASVVIADRFYGMLAALPADVRQDTSSPRFGICGAAPASADLPALRAGHAATSGSAAEERG